MDLWEKSFFQQGSIYDDIADSVETQKKFLRLMFTGESYLSEITFIKVLRKGETGTAVLYRHKTTGAFVVDKVTRKEFWAATEAELHYMTRLAKNKYFLSPVTYFQSRMQNDTNHLIMEYFNGKNLVSFVSDRILNFHSLQNILRQLGEALAYMHSKGIIHLDIKPTNILINENMECKIIDFGHSMPGPEADGRYGSEKFAAPEVIAHKYHVDAPGFGYSCDYYSLGVTALSIAANLCHSDFLTDLLGPIGEKYLPSVVALQRELNPDGPQDTFYDLIMRLIEEDPNERLNDKTFLSHPFFRKKFKKQSGRLTQKELENKVEKFNPATYKKNVRRSATAEEFQKKVVSHNNAKALMAERFASTLDLMLYKYDLPELPESSKGLDRSSFWSKLRRSFVSKREKAGRQDEDRDENIAWPDRRSRTRFSTFFSRRSRTRASTMSYYSIQYR